MGVQCEDGGGKVTLINAQITPFVEYPIVDTVNTVKSNPNVCIYLLKYVNVTVSGCDCVALEDSGCQIPLVSNRLFSWCCDETVNNVTLYNFGRDQTVRALLPNLTVCLCDVDCDNGHEILIVCAVTDLHSPDYDVILPIDLVWDLKATACAVGVSGCVATDVCDVTTETEHHDVEKNFIKDVDSLSSNQPNPDDSATLAQEREQDPTLALCWVQAQAGNQLSHSFVIYHKDQVDGQFVCQLCVPHGHRAQILRLAHESVFGGHLGNSETRHVHANKMRHLKYSLSHEVYAVVMMCVLCALLIACVTQCFMIDITIINPRDNMFGNVLTPIPVVSSCLLPSQQVKDDKVEHLQLDQRQELYQLLDEFADQFDSRPGRCDAVVHRIQTTDRFVPRQMRPYRVPDALKPKVDRQI